MSGRWRARSACRTRQWPPEPDCANPCSAGMSIASSVTSVVACDCGEVERSFDGNRTAAAKRCSQLIRSRRFLADVRKSLSPTCRLRSASVAGGATLLSVISTVPLVSANSSSDTSLGEAGLAVGGAGCGVLEAAGGAIAVSCAVFAVGVGVTAGVSAAAAVLPPRARRRRRRAARRRRLRRRDDRRRSGGRDGGRACADRRESCRGVGLGSRGGRCGGKARAVRPGAGRRLPGRTRRQVYFLPTRQG